MAVERSPWRDDQAWRDRLATDARLIAQRTDDHARAILDGLPVAVEAQFHVQFILVIGSRARGDHRPDSDLDVYIEAVGIPDDPERAPALSDGVVEVMIAPAGVLMRNVPAGEAFAAKVVREGLISYDSGAYRQALIELGERGLLDQ